MVKRRLAGLERAIDGVVLRHIIHCLALEQDVRGIVRGRVFPHAGSVTAWDHAHATRCLCCG